MRNKFKLPFNWLTKHKQKIIAWGLISLIAAYISRIYFADSFPYTHDGVNHLARFANYLAALREGQWPPRFAPYILNGYGFPVFNYNYPLANILSVPLQWVGFTPTTSFAVQVWLAVVVGTISVYELLKQHYQKTTVWFGVGLYVGSSYLINNIYWRGNIGEIWSYALVPFVWWIFTLAAQKKHYLWQVMAVFGVAGLLLSHNLFGLSGALMLFIFSFFLRVDRKWQQWWIVSWLIGVGLSLWFWLPALGELNLIVLTSDKLATQAADHLLRWSQLGWRPWRFGFSTPGLIDTLNFGLGLISWVVLGLQLVWLMVRWQKRSTTWLIHSGLLFLIFLGLFFVSTSSQWFWNNVSFISVWQFPWRILLFVSLWLVVVGSAVYSQVKGWIKVLLWLLLLAQLSAYVYLQPVDRFYYSPDYYLHFPMTTLTNNENRPRQFDLQSFGDWQPQPYILEGKGKVKAYEWLGSYRRYGVQADSDVIVVEPTVYFPGWEVLANQESVELIFPDDAKGQIAYRLPASEGVYEVESSFSERTAWRLAGEVGSLMSLFAVLVIIYKNYQES